MSDALNWTLDEQGRLHRRWRRLLRFGCWLNAHAIIRRMWYLQLRSCRCGKRVISEEAIYYRYRR